VEPWKFCNEYSWESSKHNVSPYSYNLAFTIKIPEEVTELEGIYVDINWSD
jgi:hypothetical protein